MLCIKMLDGGFEVLQEQNERRVWEKLLPEIAFVLFAYSVTD